MPNLPVAVVPGHVDTQRYDELERNIVEVTLARVIENLTATPDEATVAPSETCVF